MSHFASTKHAVSAAARSSRRLDLPGSGSGERVQSQRSDETEDMASAVRAAMVRAGISLEGEDAELLFGWSTSTDRGQTEDDVEAETAKTETEREAARVRAGAKAARLKRLRHEVRAQLAEAKLIPPPPRLIPLGWRVVEDEDGKRDVAVVPDPDAKDPGVLQGPGAEAQARRIAARELEGPVSRHRDCDLGWRRPDLGGDFTRRWEAGEFATISALDEELARVGGFSVRYARTVRGSWGIHGSRGGRATTSRRGCLTAE